MIIIEFGNDWEQFEGLRFYYLPIDHWLLFAPNSVALRDGPEILTFDGWCFDRFEINVDDALIIELLAALEDEGILMVEVVLEDWHFEVCLGIFAHQVIKSCNGSNCAQFINLILRSICEGKSFAHLFKSSQKKWFCKPNLPTLISFLPLIPSLYPIFNHFISKYLSKFNSFIFYQR